MPYFIINKQPVFLFRQRYAALEVEALKNEIARDNASKWTKPENYIGSLIIGPDSREKETLMHNVLERKFKSDPKDFYAKWVSFDLRGAEASLDVWDLLFDYCHLHGYAFLSDLRNIQDKILDSYAGEEYYYPMGKVFSLNHFVKPAKWRWGLTHKMKGRTVRIIIDAGRVNRMVGDLNDFVVHTGTCLLFCGADFGILPLNSSNRGQQFPFENEFI